MFFAVRLDPCPCPTRYPAWQCTIRFYGWVPCLQIIGDHSWSSFWFSNKQHYLSLCPDMIMFQLRHHGETHCHSQPSVMATWQTGVAGGTHITAALSARQDMCEATLYWIIYHRNSCQTTRFDYFFLPCNWGWGKSAKLFAQVGGDNVVYWKTKRKINDDLQ